MSEGGFDAPEDAAMSTFPAKYCSVIAVRAHRDDAYVLLNTGPHGAPYLYGVNCSLKGGRWYEGGSANVPGWEQTGLDPDLGTLSIWGEAPAAATGVRVRFHDEIFEEAVSKGAYLIVWWRVPCTAYWPRVLEFKIDGQWSERG